MKLNIEFVKRNLISIIVAGSILTVGGVSVASALLSDPSETTIEPSTTIEATIEPTLAPTIEPTASPIVTPEPLVTPAVITLDGVTINAINSVINAKDSVVNNPKGTTTTTTQAPIIQPIPAPIPAPIAVPEPPIGRLYDEMIPYIQNGVVYISVSVLDGKYSRYGYQVLTFSNNKFIRIYKDPQIILDNIPTIQINSRACVTYDYYLQNIKPFLNISK